MTIALTRRIFIACACLLAGMAQAQPRVGILAGGSRAADRVLVESFWRGMKDRGYIEGKNVIGEYRYAEGSLDRLPALATELVQLKVNVIVAPGSGAVAARKATSTIPIVLAYGDPLALGLVASLAHPGGNVTGLAGFESELAPKQLELLKEAFPTISRVAVLWWRGNTMQEMTPAARAMGVTLQSVELRSADDLEAAFKAMTEHRVDALVVVRNPLTVTHRARIAEYAAAHRWPAMYGDRDFVAAGGLMSYGVSIPDMWTRAAVYVDKILKGAAPRDMPIERPTKFELVVNAKAANAAGLALPPSFLARADQVLQ